MNYDFEFIEHHPEREEREPHQHTIIQADDYDKAVAKFVKEFPNTHIILVHTLTY